MTTTRRDFLLGGAAAGAALPWLSADLAPDWLLAAGAASAGADTLVVVQVRGGWDFLSILAAPDDKVYQAARPTLKLPKSLTLPVKTGSGLGWHPAMKPFKDLFDRGDLAVIQNVGYPKPNLSHFTSEKKWAAGDAAATKIAIGWLSKWLTGGYKGGFQIPALLVGARVNAFNGSRVPSMTSPTSLALQFDRFTFQDTKIEKLAMLVNALAPRPSADRTLQSVASSIQGAIRDSDLLQIAGSGYKPKVVYPNSTFARRLQLVARYVTAGMPTQVYYLNTGGYDTHRGQAVLNQPAAGRLGANLTRDITAVKAFLDDVKAYGRGGKVVVMMFSEFGRRIGENGSIGTDHGHGGISFLAGEPVVGGLYGNYPDLSTYSSPYTRAWIRFDQTSTDFRSIYATVLEKVLHVRHDLVLGQKYPLLGAL